MSELLDRARAWRDQDPDPKTQAELEALISAGDEAALEDRMAGRLAFGTAGLRGLIGAGSNRMNRAVVRQTTAGLARYLKEHVPGGAERGVVVGRDGRRMSEELADEVARVLVAEGVVAHVLPGLAPTPFVAYATVHTGAAAGVVVTASHNPPEYNGYKVYWGDGAQIVPPVDKGIAATIEQVGPANELPIADPAQGRERGLWRDVGPEVEASYLDALFDARLAPTGGQDFPIVYSAMHGVGGRWVVDVLRRGGYSQLHPVAEQHEPDGEFPTVRFPNPEEPGAMDRARALADATKAELVLANDPDADRLAVEVRAPDGSLRALSGNEIGVLLGHHLLTERSPAPSRPLVVTTIVSSTQLSRIAAAEGALYGETLTGFKWIAHHAMERKAREGASFVFGYEEALGYSVGPVVGDKDGIGAALAFADLVARCRTRGQTVVDYLESIQRRYGLHLSHQHSVVLPGTQGASTIRAIMAGFRENPPSRVGAHPIGSTVDYARGGELPPADVLCYHLEGGGRVLLRPSGTEPKIKYYFEHVEQVGEGESIADAHRRAETTLKAAVEAFLGLARERGQPE